MRRSAWAAKSNPPRIVSSVLAAKPLSSRTRCAWQASRRDLAYFFATNDIVARLAKGAEDVSHEKIRKEKIAIKADQLLKIDAFLLRRVREMPWTDFKKYAQFRPIGSGLSEPTKAQNQQALKSAVIEVGS